MRKRTPFTIYPKAADRAKAAAIAEAEDLHIGQVFLRAFRRYAAHWERRRLGQQPRQVKGQ